jgi:hypothetical protein
MGDKTWSDKARRIFRADNACTAKKGEVDRSLWAPFLAVAAARISKTPE